MSQTQKAAYRVVPFMQNAQSREIHRDRKQISGCQGLMEEGSGDWLLICLGFLFEVMKIFWNQIVVMDA